MENFQNLFTETDIRTLRERIKNKYRQYNWLDRDRFPEFEYNTNRVNYTPLRESFEEELYVVRGVDRTSPVIHIPSTNTLALLFTDHSYIPGKNIFNTCHLYAEGKEKADPDTIEIIKTPPKNRKAIKIYRRLISAGLMLIGIGLAIFAYLTQSSLSGNLIIYRPYHRQIVPRILSITGKATNADTVWIVIRPVRKGEKCYVQSPAVVEKDGTWKGAAIIGTLDEGTVGMTFQIRAFVNPGGSYEAIKEEGEYVFDSWPEEAELSTEVVEVIRGPKIKK